MGDGLRNRRGIDQLVSVNAGQRTARYIAHHVAARALGREPNGVQRVHHLRQRFDRQPMQLNVLAHRDVCQVPRVVAGDLADLPQLARGDDSVGNPDPHHEPFGGQAFPAFAAGRAYAVALRIHAPPFEIGRSPLRHHARAPLARKRANFVKCLPGILLALQPLHPLSFGLFWRSRFAHLLSSLSFRSNKMPARALRSIAGIGKPWTYTSKFRPRSPVPRGQQTAPTTGL